MKKDVFLLSGIGALVLTGAIGGTWMYKRSQLASVDAVSVDEKLKSGASGSPSIGPIMARVGITEFLDPECESCRVMHPIVKKILKDYEGRIHYQLRYMPLHPNSMYAASLLEAAREQGKYWEALDLLFARQPEWADHHAPRPELILKILAEIGIDPVKLEADSKNPAIKERIEKDRSDGQMLGVQGTPTFFVNDSMLDELGDEALRASLDAALK